MRARLEEFLAALADELGADQFRTYCPDPADADLNSFREDLGRLDEYEADGLLASIESAWNAIGANAAGVAA